MKEETVNDLYSIKNYKKVKDSGGEQLFSTGAKRDSQEGKSRPDLISPIFLQAVKEKSLPTEINLKEYVNIFLNSIDSYGLNHQEDDLITAAKSFMYIIHFQETMTFWPNSYNLSPYFTSRLGYWLMLGAARYKERNWESGINLSRSYASLCRHKDQWLNNQQDEDHAGAILCNLMFLYHTKIMIDNGKLPKELDDFIKYL